MGICKAMSDQKQVNIYLPPPEVKLWLMLCNLAEPERQAVLESVVSCADGGHLSCCKRPSKEPYFPSDVDPCAICRSGAEEGYPDGIVKLGWLTEGKCQRSELVGGMPCRMEGWKGSVATGASACRSELERFKGGDVWYGLAQAGEKFH